MINDVELNVKLTSFEPDFDQERAGLAQDEIEAFNRAFPKKSIEALTKERYALGAGNSRDNFSWWIEYGTGNVAAMGGFASKHRLYFSKKSNQYEYPLRYSNADEALEDIKENIMKLYDVIASDKLKDYDAVDLPHNQAMKISYLLRGQKFLPILDKKHLEKICDELGLQHENMNSIQRNRLILNKFKENQVSKDWSTAKIAQFIYSKYGFNLKKDEAEKERVESVDLNSNSGFLLTCKKQVILYGPPGTGKTFKTKMLSTQLIDKI